MSEIRIVIADDHPIFRKGLRDTIETDPTLTEDQRNALRGMQYRNLAYCLHEGIISVGVQPGQMTSNGKPELVKVSKS